MTHRQAAGVPHGDDTLKAFAREFFTALGSSPVPVHPDLWKVELAPEQKAALAPPPVLPWWASPPPPPEPATWWLAFSRESLEAQPQARLLTRSSQLFQQMRTACRERGAVFTGTLVPPAQRLGHAGSQEMSPSTLKAPDSFSEPDLFRPVLWLHLRLSRRGGRNEDVLAPWACRLDDGYAAWAPPPDPLRLWPGPPPPGSRVERIRLSAEEIWHRLKDGVVAKEEARRDGWEREALARLREETRTVEDYYAALLAQQPEDAEKLQRERERRLAEVHGRHRPVVQVRPVAASLIYLPSSVNYPWP